MQEKAKKAINKHAETNTNDSPADILANTKSILTDQSGKLPRLSKKIIKEITNAVEQGNQEAIEIVTILATQGQPWAKLSLGKNYIKEKNYIDAINCFSDEDFCRSHGGYKQLALIYIDRTIPTEFRIKAFENCLAMAKGTGDPLGIEAVEKMLNSGTSILPYELYVDATQWAMNQSYQRRYFDRWQFKRKKK